MTFTVSKTVSDETLNCIVTIESGGRPTIKAPTSSALGLGQFLNATWLNVVAKHRPDIFHATDKETLLALRTNPSFSIEMLARFTEDNQRIVGMDCSPGDLYLAHFLGDGAAKKVYAADPATPMESLVAAAAISANRSIMQGKNAGEVRAWAARRMAQSGGHDWVAKYYHAAYESAPAEQDKGAPIPEETEQDIPSLPSPAPRRDPVPPVTPAVPKEEEGWSDWLMKLAKSKIQWASTIMGTVSVTSISGVFGDALKDPRVIIAMVSVVGALLAVIIIERGRKP